MATAVRIRIVVTLASLVLAVAVPAKAAPIDGLHFLVGTWKCTYRAGTVSLPYAATFAYDLAGHTLRETTSSAVGADEEVFAYDPQRRGWTTVILDDHGSATVMRGTGRDPNHIAYRSVYPDASIAETIDRLSATEYAIHATVRLSGKTMSSVDTCTRHAPSR